MSSVSSVNRHRISTYHVNRKTNNLDVARVDALERVNPTQNSAASANDNFAMFSEIFYGKLMELKRFYERFYRNEQALEESIRHFREGAEFDSGQFQQQVLELVEKYNQAYQSLTVFEREIGLHHSRLLTKIIRKHETHLNRLGIRLLTTGLLKADQAVLTQNLTQNPDSLQILFNKQSGLLYELVHQFRSVQAQPNHSQFLQLKQQLSETISKGSLVDEKS